MSATFFNSIATFVINTNYRFLLVYQENGFVLTLKKTELEESGKVDLPKGFVNVSSKKGKWVFETMELVSCLRDDMVVC